MPLSTQDQATVSRPVETSAAFQSARREPKKGFVGLIYLVIGWFLENFIELMVITTGKRISRTEEPWLDCPLGDSVLIGAGIYEQIAHDENLELKIAPGAGLIADFDSLRGPT